MGLPCWAAAAAGRWVQQHSAPQLATGPGPRMTPPVLLIPSFFLPSLPPHTLWLIPSFFLSLLPPQALTKRKLAKVNEGVHDVYV